MDRHGLWQWRSLTRIPLRHGLHLHRGLRYSRLRPRRAKAGLRMSVGARDDARGQATGAVIRPDRHINRESGWHSAGVGHSPMRIAEWHEALRVGERATRSTSTLTTRARRVWSTRMIPRRDRAEWGSAETRCVEEATPTTIMTTFYDLIAAIHAVVEPDAADLAVPVLVQLLESGRITFLGDVEELNRWASEPSPERLTV